MARTYAKILTTIWPPWVGQGGYVRTRSGYDTTEYGHTQGRIFAGGSHSVQPVARRVEVNQLVGATEIAARLGVKRPQVVHEWRRRHDDFPAPVAQLATALVWYWPDVEGWARNTGRLPEAPVTRRTRKG